MKLVLFIDSLADGGAQRQLANLSIGLQQRDHSVTVITYAPIENHLERIQAAGVQHICLNKGSRLDMKPVVKLAKIIRQIKPSITIAFLRTPSVYAECAKLLAPGIPLLVSERAGLIDGKLRLSDKIACVMHLSANGIVANSQAYADGMVSFFPPLKNRTHVIYNGVNKAFFNVGKARIVRDAKASRITHFCVVAARAGIAKGPQVLVRAIAALHDKGHTDFKVDWIGPANDQDIDVKSTNALLAELNLTSYWRWLGHVPNIVDHYDKYDALICPSLHEGIPNVICESMACALPVIATNVGDNRLIIDTPSQGLRCDANDIKSLADAMHVFMSYPSNVRNNIALAAHKKAQELFAMNNYIDHWEAAIQKQL